MININYTVPLCIVHLLALDVRGRGHFATCSQFANELHRHLDLTLALMDLSAGLAWDRHLSYSGFDLVTSTTAIYILIAGLRDDSHSSGLCPWWAYYITMAYYIVCYILYSQCIIRVPSGSPRRYTYTY